MRVIFYHGLESNPNGSKPTALREAFPQLEAPDFQGMEYEDRFAKAEAELMSGEPAVLIGSSLGGLMAAELADKHPEMVKGYLLLAPAILRQRGPIAHAPDASMMILGDGDEIEGLNDAALEFSRDVGVNVLMVNDSHRLKGHLPLVVAMAKAIYNNAQAK